jgi:hypothetical protein
MDQLTNTVVNVYKWAKSDFHSWPARFVLEISAWFMSIGCAVTMAATLPHPPFLILYPIFIIQCIIFAWSAWTRKSTGLVANYLLLVTIDIIGLARLIIIQ